MQHPRGCSNTSHGPLGCPALEQKGNGVAVAQLGSSVPSLSMPSPSPDSHHPWGGIALQSCPHPPRVRLKVCGPQAFLTASPSHPPRLPRLPFTGAALLAPGPGACAWVETASRWSYFFTFLGGRGGRFGKKLPGPGKQREGEGLKGVWLAWCCFCREWRVWQGN